MTPMGPAASAAFSLHLDLAAAQAVDALAEAGVPAVALKGPSVAMWLYPDGSRGYNDVDLLVPLGSLPAARRVLEGLGYTCNYSPLGSGGTVPSHVDHHAEYWHRGPAKIDLHWRIPGTTVDAERGWEVLARHVERMRIGSRELPVLSEPARALHVILHCAQHGADEPQPARDAERLVAVFPDDRWPEVVALAEQLGALGALGVGLNRTAAGRDVAERHRVRGRIDDLYVALNAIGTPAGAAGLDRVEAGLRGHASLRDVWGVLFPPPAMMRTMQPLARRGPLGLAAAYATRLADRLVRLPRGYLALRRARRLLRDEL
jgi:hypothetical protein